MNFRIWIEAKEFDVGKYTITHRIIGDGVYKVSVRYENNEIGTAYFIEKDNNIKVQPGSHISVHPNHRRKGIATAMFKYIEKLLGKNTIPGILTPAGKMFWLDYQRNLT